MCPGPLSVAFSTMSLPFRLLLRLLLRLLPLPCPVHRHLRGRGARPWPRPLALCQYRRLLRRVSRRWRLFLPLVRLRCLLPHHPVALSPPLLIPPLPPGSMHRPPLRCSPPTLPLPALPPPMTSRGGLRWLMRRRLTRPLPLAHVDSGWGERGTSRGGSWRRVRSSTDS